MGASLQPGEHGAIDLLLIVVLNLLSLLVHTFDPSAIENEPGTRTTERLVCRRGNHVAILKGTWVQLWVQEGGWLLQGDLVIPLSLSHTHTQTHTHSFSHSLSFLLTLLASLSRKHTHLLQWQPVHWCGPYLPRGRHRLHHRSTTKNT